jgi:hypothetical protein
MINYLLLSSHADACVGGAGALDLGASGGGFHGSILISFCRSNGGTPGVSADSCLGWRCEGRGPIWSYVSVTLPPVLS